MYDEEKFEEKINSLPPDRREEWQPDGLNAPPEAKPRCRHIRVRPVPGWRAACLGQKICLDCGKVSP
jgi:hypothetical protein